MTGEPRWRPTGSGRRTESRMSRTCTTKFCSLLLFGVMFLQSSPVRVITPAPPGMFQWACLQRHFLLSVQSGALGPMWRLDFEDRYGRHFLSRQEAAICGYTVLTDVGGALVLRASFLGCHVSSQVRRHFLSRVGRVAASTPDRPPPALQGGSDYRLGLWFVALQAGGEAAAFPLRLRCPLLGGWSSREVVCEENYLEVRDHVSLQPPLAPPAPRDEAPAGGAVGVRFHRGSLTPTDAPPRGYHLSLRGSRLTLRCPRSSPLSYVVKEDGMELEVVRATVLYRLRGRVLGVAAAAACVLGGAQMDGSDLVWGGPYILSPLVRGGFWDGGVGVGLNGQILNGSQNHEGGVQVSRRGGRLEVRIPFGVRGGRLKSGGVRGQYGRSMSVDLLVVRQWADGRWPLTQHRCLRRLATPLLLQSPSLNMGGAAGAPSDGVLSATLGVFAADASLQKVTLHGGGDLLTWTPTSLAPSKADLSVTRIAHGNGSHSYRLRLPLAHPKIIPESIGGGWETYSLTFTFMITIDHTGETIHHQETVEHRLTHTGYPTLEGKCKESSLLVLLRHGAQSQLHRGAQAQSQLHHGAQSNLDLLLGGRRLDWDLVEMGGLVVEAEEDYLTVEIPSHSPGATYLELTLQALVSGVDVSLVDSETLELHARMVHQCSFPVQELLVCLPEGRMVALVDTTHTAPPTHPNGTSLLDPSCVPVETDSSRALFSFSLASCGTSVTTEGNFLVYENQISSSPDPQTPEDPLIHRDSPYRLTLQCRYPMNETSTVATRRHGNPSMDGHPSQVKEPRG
ncbi:uncharacterized protein [Antennarius striatus]|uniref:uncharacterized protein n=1 Tax=Antennarius striatus TaxID=241820 RepID=UPI0035B0C353